MTGRLNMVRLPLVLGLALWIAACTAKYPVVGSFDDFNEVFLGSVDHNLSTGRAFIQVEAEKAGFKCTGNSRVVHIPASNRIAGAFLIPYCKGQRGEAVLTCNDGRRIDADWTAETCTTGYGSGYDQNGARFQFAFGMSEAEALSRFKKDEVRVAAKPELPVYRPKETRKEIGYSTGTGFLVTFEGHMLTNFHVIEDASEVFVRIDGKEVPASVLKTDPENDVALIKADVVGVPIATGGADGGIAEDVMALGYPLVRIQGQALKASFGRINSLSGIKDDPRFLQIDVPIQPGNSGGPLIGSDGRLVGVVTATLDQLNTLREAGVLPQNVNYAVKSDFAQPMLAGLNTLRPGRKQLSFQELVERYENSVHLIVAR